MSTRADKERTGEARRIKFAKAASCNIASSVESTSRRGVTFHMIIHTSSVHDGIRCFVVMLCYAFCMLCVLLTLFLCVLVRCMCIYWLNCFLYVLLHYGNRYHD